VYQKLIELKNELYPTGNLDSIIVAHQASLLQFTPDEFVRSARTLKKNQYDRVVLAELFTGSECKPCQAADIAFDYLIERYRTSSLAILEYHLHIPMPDPMTNEDAEHRAEWYGVRSTPTAVFNGKTMITSGGNRMMAKNKFFLYSDIIEREGREPVPMVIAATAVLEKGNVSIRGTANVPAKSSTLRLRMMLVEDEVFYKGANGIEQHKFVVRKMITPEKGLTFPSTGKLTVTQKVNLGSVSESLEKYYAATNERYTKLGAPLKEKKSTLDQQRLAVVMFVQDEETKEVFQAVTVKVDAIPKKK
jgi:thiol-disulfide isomerase/thioredoxin